MRLFLDGKSDELLARLRRAHEGGRGAHRVRARRDLRDQIRALEATLEEQRVVSADFVDQDVVGFTARASRWRSS